MGLVMLKCLFLLLLTASVSAIFEDQVGKFDWRSQFIGCPSQVVYRRLKPSQGDLIYVSSEANVVAAIKPTTGDIAWRQALEPDTKPALFLLHKKYLISIGRDNNVIRAWEREKGIFVWEAELPDSDRASAVALGPEASLIVLGALSVHFISVTSGEIKWSSSLEENRSRMGVFAAHHKVVTVGISDGKGIVIEKFDLASGKLNNKYTIPSSWCSSDRCFLIGTNVVCFDSRAFYVVDAASEGSLPLETLLPNIRAVLPLEVDGFVGFKTYSKTFIYDLHHTAPSLISSYDKVEAAAMAVSVDNKKYVGLIMSGNGLGKFVIDDVLEKKVVFEASIKEPDYANVKDIHLAISGRDFELVTIGDDCRIDLYVTAYGKLVNEWTRHEALSSIDSVELVDLPLSEAQAGIESEFTIRNGNIIESFVHRLLSQINQVRRAAITAGKEIFSAASLENLRTKSVSDWFAFLRFNTAAKGGRGSDQPLERDYFNLRKIIVATTPKKTVYGLDSADGSVLWHLPLGKNMLPLKTSLDKYTVPLFIQRTTAYFQYRAQAAVVFTDKLTSNGVIVTFDPVTGGFFERLDLVAPVKRVELLPFADDNNLHRLVVIDDSNKVSIVPPVVSQVISSLPLHLFSFDVKGHLEGTKLDLADLKLVPQWKSTLALLPSQSIVAVIGKPSSQQVHSSGRVLADRSVLYKYSNPNLVAVIVADEEHSSLSINLVDAVTGYFVYSAKQNKVSKPFHFVHCENWLTYSYWNEKARRNEIGVIELYEGLKQTNELSFNSLTPVISPVVNAVTQAYIFPQGISAIGVTDTEKGLSTRSILLAMPFGGIYGVSKRMLDPRRPLEMTPEFAEEMLIPYRPELPLVSEDFINYNQTVLKIRGIKTGSSGLESTSLVFAYGLDIFFTRMTPSGTFDILKDDFDHKLITLVLLALVIGSFICKKLGRNHTLKQAWQ